MKFYHSTPVPLTGVSLNPTTRNIVPATDGLGKDIALFTEYADQNDPYLFATDNLQLSLTYAVPKGVRLANLHGYGGTEILLLDQESRIGDPDLEGGVYSFESGNFRQIHVDGKGIDQWVSPDPVFLMNAEYTPVRSLNDIMKQGVQIYQVADDVDYDAAAFYRDIREIKDDPDDLKLLSLLKDLTLSGKLRWMNAERGINPVECLEKPAALPPSPGAVLPKLIQS